MALEIGQEAPELALKDEHGQVVRLSDFRGEKNVAIVFYPFAFSGTCTGELCEIRDNLAVFEADNVQVLAVSCDSAAPESASPVRPCRARGWRRPAPAFARPCNLPGGVVSSVR